MSKIKKWLMIILAGILTFATFGLVACEDKEDGKTDLGEFYTLQEAYDNNYISHDDLTAVAELINANQESDLGTLKAEEADAIKSLYSKLYNTSIYEVRIKFYGNYNNAIAVVVSSSDFGGATVITTITVEGVDFIYPDSATEVLIWKR